MERGDRVNTEQASTLKPLFEPRSIAIVGASDDLSKTGGRVLECLRFNEFKGRLFPVNPRRTRVQGLPAFASIGDVGERPDLVILSVPAKDVEAEARRACDAGAAGLVVYASGFAEVGSDGEVAQQRITDLVRGRGVRMIGPNCLGIMNGNNGMIASGTIMMQGRRLKSGELGFVSQSGALGMFWMDMMADAHLGVSKFASTGNEADVDVAAVLEYLVEDPGTRVIGMYIEGVKHGQALRRALSRAQQARKPVVVLKAGGSKAGAAAVASHTGKLAGDDELYRCLFERYGVCRVDSLGEMIEVSRILATQKVPAGRRTCIISSSGGAGALTADAAAAVGFEMPPLSEQTALQLKPHFPPYVQLKNPIDLTDRVTSDPGMVRRTLEILMASGEFDHVIAFMAGRSQVVVDEVGHGAFQTVLPRWPGGHAAVWQSGPATLIEALKAAHVSLSADIPAAVKALARAAELAAAPPAAGLDVVPPVRSFAKTKPLAEWEGKLLLKRNTGVASPKSVRVGTVGEVGKALDVVGTPVAMKLQSVDMPHKSGHGGIELGLADAAAVEAAVKRMLAIAQDRGLRHDGVLIEEMYAPQFELIVGFKHDPVLGPFLLLGRGGVLVEVQPDVVRGFLPLSPASIERMLRSLKMGVLLDGFRGRPPAPVQALANTIATIGAWFERDAGVAEIEINPLAVDRHGRILALDALVTVGA